MSGRSGTVDSEGSKGLVLEKEAKFGVAVVKEDVVGPAADREIRFPTGFEDEGVVLGEIGWVSRFHVNGFAGTEREGVGDDEFGEAPGEAVALALSDSGVVELLRRRAGIEHIEMKGAAAGGVEPFEPEPVETVWLGVNGGGLDRESADLVPRHARI